MKTREGVSSTQVAITVVIVLVLAAAGAYFALTPPGVTTTTATVTVTTSQTTSTPTGVTPHTIVVQRNAPLSNLDPRATSAIEIVQQIYESLTYVKPDGTIVPGLALSWTPNSDFTNWQYNLRQGVKFHDGSIFNATDVVFSVKNTKAFGQNDAPDVWSTLKDVVATGPYSVTFTTTQSANMPQITAAAYQAPIFSHNVMKISGATDNTTSLAKWFNAPHGDGTGPYMLNASSSSFSAGQVVLNQFPAYWGGWKNGQITDIIYKVVTNVDTAVQLALKGQLDVIGISGQYQYVPQLLGAGLQVKNGPSFAAIWLLFNNQHQYLNNQLVRQALLSAIDFNQVVNQAFYGYGAPFGGIVNPGKSFYDPAAPGYGPKPNATVAKALLKQAGYPGGLNVTWTVTYSTGSPFEGTIAQLLQTYWAPLGVTLNIQGMSFTQQTIKAGYVDSKGSPFSPGNFSYAATSKSQDLALLNWVGSTADPWLVPNNLFAVQSPPYQNSIIFNWSYWKNQTFTDLLNKARVDEALNPQLAQSEFKTLNLMFYQAAPGHALFATNQVWVISPHFQGYVANPYYGFDFWFFYQFTYQP
jgi:ABC-type transport system substrate-binding protein